MLEWSGEAIVYKVESVCAEEQKIVSGFVLFLTRPGGVCMYMY